ncbi:papilin isoform X2 [Thrips palmi]|uniref:Papilin isoform X2 n=1 Tax=Thrips palmi TaxID=161013 RepID=A0A6P8ZLR5_THRPL|nr:papilin isoform X2 [Thrips palmi]
MDLHRLLRSLGLLIFILATYFSSAIARHPIRHHHDAVSRGLVRYRRQHGAGQPEERRQSEHPHQAQGQADYQPQTYVWGGSSAHEGAGGGDWGPWSAPGACSRSCGGGVASQTRQCLGPRCSGADLRYFSCNIQDCPPTAVDFRAEQCAEFDRQPFEDRYYSWVPYTKSTEVCELNCMPRGERFYYRHRRKVADGTRCDEERQDVCVDGRCLPVGCDLMLGSSRREDQCRECGGDGSGCTTYQRQFEINDLQAGYNDILLIPSGSTNIRVREVKPSNNYLAVRNTSGHYYINGNWRIDYPRTFNFAGCIFHYERKPQPEFFAPESLFALGPTNEDLYIVMLYQEPGPGLEYEYSVPKGIASRLNDPDSYAWQTDEFSGCSATCGGGYKVRRVWCARKRDMEMVANGLCNTATIPVANQTCAPEPCPPGWITDSWSACSESCGRNGTRTRQVYCGQIMGNGLPTVVDEGTCRMLNVPKPATSEPCGTDSICPSWFKGPWKACDKLCGEGKQRRQVTCYLRRDGRIEILGDNYCPNAKPAAEQDCFLRPCEGVDWVTSPWSGCEDSCGLVSESRTAVCASKSGKIYPDSQCHAYRKPKLERECLGGGACDYEWFASQWSKCSSKCGAGVRTRKVFCSSWDNDTLTHADDDKCDPELKYHDSEECVGNATCKGAWYSGPWSECSKLCGGGEMTRKVLCILNNQTVPITECDADLTADSSDSCNTHACGEDETLSVSASPITSASPEEVSTIESMDDDEDCLEYEEEEEVIEVRGGWGLLEDDDEEDTTDEPEPTEASSVPSATEPGSAATDSTAATETSGTDATGATDASAATDATSGTDVTEASSGTDGTAGTAASVGTDASAATESSAGTEASSGTDATAATESSAGTDATSEASTDATTDATTTDATTTDATTTDATTVQPAGATEQMSADDPGAGAAATDVPADASTTDASTTDASTTDAATTEASSTDATSAASVDASAATDVSSATESAAATESSAASVDASGATAATDTSTDSTAVGVRAGATDSTADSAATDATADSAATDSSVTPGMDTASSVTESTSSVFDPWGSTTSATLDEVTGKRKRKCKRRKRKKPDPAKCHAYEFGCCWDKETEAKGPFGEGCPEAKTCKETKFGCCSDEVSPADGPDQEGCPVSQCAESLFGCCQDKTSAAQGNNFEGCPEPETLPFDCKKTQFGCCPDGVMAAQGKKYQGCFECEGSGECNSCKDTKYGCCPASERAATGPFFQGCEGLCAKTKYGCCPDNKTPAKGKKNKGCPKAACTKEKNGCCADGITPAHGPDQLGCCINTEFGCCPDNMTPAKGPRNEGCTCENTKWGCCPDNYTIATGKNNSGCGCYYTEHGCCPDGVTAAPEAGYKGCPCWTYQFGCCPDGETVARGPSEAGCGCENTEFGCCEDGVTKASGPGRGEGCHCAASRFGCCPDGNSTAQGTRFEGCADKPFNPSEGCMLEKDRGTCRNFTAWWFFDKEYGGCARFWYGGCEGNANRFRSQDECRDVCVEPQGRDVCSLPKIEGPCEGYYPTWYHDQESGQCRQFIYKGCLGNANRFKTREECNSLCVPETLDACSAPVEPGPCNGSTPRWYFDKDSRTCHQFAYGGCKGNKNNFATQAACLYKCNKPGESREVCGLAKEQGDCTEKLARWSFDASENRCVPFYHSGCGGNGNTFATKQTCEADCPKRVAQDVCMQPALTGECHNYTQRWYYDALEAQCKPFYYGNCGGNHNNFQTREACQQRCERGAAPEPPPQSYPEPYRPPQPQQPAEPQLTARDICFMPEDPGHCQESQPKWRYDRRDGVCRQFAYSGCGGNRNNFDRREDCEQTCANVQDACSLPKTEGPCRAATRAYFYNARQDQCEEFLYGGCQGNANRFQEKLECEQRCVRDPSRAPGLNARFGQPGAGAESPQASSCSVRVDPGPCTEYYIQYYFDDRSNSCQPFQYGGCGGSVNRYNSEEQCERVCGTLRGQDVCNLPYETGPCRGSAQKWFYDAGVGICREFNYGGCRGNGNRFSSSEECTALCVQKFELPVQTNASAAGAPPPEENAIETGDRCEAARRECADLRCPYGVTRKVDASGCELCNCYNPCEGMVCAPDQQCGIELARSRDPAEPMQFRPVCRLINKPGECPAVSSRSCSTDCYSDADCSGEAKCCYNGCGQSCVHPASDAAPLSTAPPPPQRPYEEASPQVQVAEPQVTASEGGFATLRCIATGYPLPTVTWRKDSVTIESAGGRHKILTDGSLQIIGLVRTDSGIYLCIADNGIGPAVTKEFRLDVTAPVHTNISASQTTFPVGGDVSIPCQADGYPIPKVTWFKDNVRLDPSDTIRIAESNRLEVLRADANASGTYRCEAANQYASHWSEVVITVTGAYIHPNCTDNPFFANCQLIVRAQYCTHRYYARFCCRSCTEAGQLPSHGPHLDDTQQGPAPRGRFGRRRRSLSRKMLIQIAQLAKLANLT